MSLLQNFIAKRGKENPELRLGFEHPGVRERETISLLDLISVKSWAHARALDPSARAF